MIPQSHPAYLAVSPLLTPILGESKNCPGLYRAPKRKGGVCMDGWMDKIVSAKYIP